MDEAAFKAAVERVLNEVDAPLDPDVRADPSMVSDDPLTP